MPLGPGRWECECAPGYKLQPDGKRCTATGDTHTHTHAIPSFEIIILVSKKQPIRGGLFSPGFKGNNEAESEPKWMRLISSFIML